jgi:hypothetical protein
VKRVYRAASLLQVAHARNILISAGIECELRNVHLAGALGDLPMMETWPQLYVHDGDERYALGLRGMRRAARAAIHVLLALRVRQAALSLAAQGGGGLRGLAGVGGHALRRGASPVPGRNWPPAKRRPTPLSHTYDFELQRVFFCLSDEHLQELAQSLRRGSAVHHGQPTLHRLQITLCRM